MSRAKLAASCLIFLVQYWPRNAIKWHKNSSAEFRSKMKSIEIEFKRILNSCLWFNDCIHFLSMSVDVSHNFKLWPDFEEISSKNFFLRQKNDFKISPLQASITKFKRYESIIFLILGLRLDPQDLSGRTRPLRRASKS